MSYLELYYYGGISCFFFKPLEILSAQIESVACDESPRKNIKKLFSECFQFLVINMFFVLFVCSLRVYAVIHITKIPSSLSRISVYYMSQGS